MTEDATPQAPKKGLIDTLADRHGELESLVKTAAQAWRDVTQPDRTHDWQMSVLLILAFLFIVSLTGALAVTGHFDPSVAFIFGTALGAIAAIMKDYLLPVAN